MTSDGLRLRTFGALVLERERTDAPPEVVYRAGKLLALLLHLSVHRGSPLPRPAVADLLWGDEAPDRARASLRQALNSLTRLLGPDAIEATRTTVMLRPEAVPTDRERFLATLQHFGATPDAGGAATPLDALAVYQGPFLADEPHVTEAFDGWVLAERQRLRHEFLRVASWVGESALARGAGPDALRVAALVRSAEPQELLGVTLAFDGHALLGEVASAQRVIEAWRVQRDHPEAPLPEAAATRLERARRELARSPAPLMTVDAADLGGVGTLFVGRQGVLERLTAIAERARRGVPTRLLLSGPSGVGKSRLLDEFEARLRLRGARVARVRLLPAMRDVPFAALADVTRVLAALPGALGVSEASAAALVEFLPELRRSLGTQTGPTDDGDRVRRRIEAFRDLVGAVADDRFVVLIVDDAQHLDGRSRQAFEQLAMLREGRILVLLAARPPVALDPASVEVLEVPTFGIAEVRALLASVSPWPTTPWAEPLLTRLTDLTGGLPQRVIEVLRVAEASGLLERRDDGWATPDPDGVAQRIGELRPVGDVVASLPEAARQLLLVLRVWGRPILEETMLGAAARLDSQVTMEAWRDALRAVEAQGFVVAGWNTWSMAHDSVGEAVDATLTDRLRGEVLDAIGGQLLSGETIAPALLDHLALLCGQADQRALLEAIIRELTRRAVWRRQRLGARRFCRQIAAAAGRPEWELPIFRRLGWVTRQSRTALAWYSALAASLLLVASTLLVLAWPRLVIDVEPMGEDVGPRITGDSAAEHVVVFYVQPRLSVRNGFGQRYAWLSGRVRVSTPFGQLRGDSVAELENGTVQFRELGLLYPRFQDIPEARRTPVLRFSAAGLIWRSPPVAVRGAQVGEPTRFTLRRVVIDGHLVPLDAAATVRAGDSIHVEVTFEYTTTGATANYVVGAAPNWVPAREATIRLAGLPRPVQSAWQTVRFVLPPAPPGHGHLVIAFGADDSAEHLMSGTTWTVGPPVWGDGNELVDLSEAQVQTLRRDGGVNVPRYMTRSYLGRLAHVKFGTKPLQLGQQVLTPVYAPRLVQGSAIEFTVTPRSPGGR